MAQARESADLSPFRITLGRIGAMAKCACG